MSSICKDFEYLFIGAQLLLWPLSGSPGPMCLSYYEISVKIFRIEITKRKNHSELVLIVLQLVITIIFVNIVINHKYWSQFAECAYEVFSLFANAKCPHGDPSTKLQSVRSCQPTRVLCPMRSDMVTQCHSTT